MIYSEETPGFEIRHLQMPRHLQIGLQSIFGGPVGENNHSRSIIEQCDTHSHNTPSKDKLK